MVYSRKYTIEEKACREKGRLALSGLLQAAQEISQEHCEKLGFSREIMEQKGLFWVVLRHKISIVHLPKAGQTVTLETWPMPTTRVAYPRVVQALDAEGNVLFQVLSIWATVDAVKRTIVLPEKGKIAIAGLIRGNEPEMPGKWMPRNHENTHIWQVKAEETDQNGHVNNSKYLDQVEKLTGLLVPKEVTVCYLSEVLPEEKITLCWGLSAEGVFTLDGYRIGTDVHSSRERVFAVRVVCK